MQTFLPYSDFRRSAAVLDLRRLGKQRVEALQVLRALSRSDYGWQHHPVVRMWRGYEDALLAYAVAVTMRWRALGYADTVLETVLAEAPCPPQTQSALSRSCRLPWWLGMRRLHRSHRSALVRKAPAHYRQFFPDVPDDLPYVWPDGAPPGRRARATAPGPIATSR